LHQLLQQPIVSLAVWGFCIQREIDRWQDKCWQGDCQYRKTFVWCAFWGDLRVGREKFEKGLNFCWKSYIKGTQQAPLKVTDAKCFLTFINMNQAPSANQMISR
jgi:hypothetical protein